MPADGSTLTASRSLSGGWWYDEQGNLHAPERTEDALAEHCTTLDGRPFTRITKGKSWRDGGHFVCNVSGHLSDGAAYFNETHRCTYRLTLVAGRRQEAA